MKYRVRKGRRFGAQNQYKGGSIIELTEAQAKSFMDKLELADEGVKKTIPSTLSELDGMKPEWLEALSKLEIENLDDFKLAASEKPELITSINGIGEAKLAKFLEACP